MPSKTKLQTLSFKIELKDMGAGNLTSTVIDTIQEGERLAGGPVYDPARSVRVRDITTVRPTTKDHITWVRETGTTGGAAMVPMAGSKPVMDKDADLISRPVKKNSCFMSVSQRN